LTITITGNPGVPDLNDPANFLTDAQAFFTWLTGDASGDFIYQLENLEASDFFSVVGTVSQSGGNPTGDIIERGSNANGEYVRFADGTQMCWAEVTLSYGNATVCQINPWTYPAGFVAIPVFALTLNENSVDNAEPKVTELGALSTAAEGTTGTIIRQYRVSGLQNFVSGDTLIVRATAIGRWFWRRPTSRGRPLS